MLAWRICTICAEGIVRHILVFLVAALGFIGFGFALSCYATLGVNASAAPSGNVIVSNDDDVPIPPQADERSKEMRRFDRYDTDHDGHIVRMEFLASRQKAFARLDQNHDGTLSFDEYAVKATDKYLKADKDKSQSLDRAEFAATKPVRKSRPSAKCVPAAQPAAPDALDV